MFKKERTFLSTRKEYYNAAKGELDFKTITKEELLLLRNKIIRQRKVELRRGWGIAILLILPVVIFGVHNFNQNRKENASKIEKEKENYLYENSNEYSYLIEEGDKWIEKKNYNNAIYRYQQAVDLFPENFEANYRLALAYSYHCTYNHKNCKDGRLLTKRLLKYYPDNADVSTLKLVFEKNE